MKGLETQPGSEFAMDDDENTAAPLDLAVHDLAQNLQVIAMTLEAIERRDGARHAKLLEPARRALESLDRGLEALVELARRSRR